MSDPHPRPTRFVPPTKKYAGYIFDFDGTLVDSMPLHHRAWQHALGVHGATFDFHWDLFLSRAGMSLPSTVVELNAQFGTALGVDDLVATQREYHVAHLHEVAPISEVVEFARACARHAKVGIASGGAEDPIRSVLERLGLADVFSAIVTPAQVRHGKPAPDSFLLCADLLGVAREECLVIEDGDMGFEAARAAGMDVAVVAPWSPQSG